MGFNTLVNRFKKTGSINILRHLSQLLIGVLIARQLGVEDKGLHFVFTSIAAAIAILGSFGFINSIVFHLKKKYINARKMFSYVMLALLILISNCGLLYYVGAEFLKNMLFDNGILNETVVLLFFLYVVSALLNYFINSFCLAFNKMGLYLFCFAFSSFISLALVWVGSVFYNYDIVDCLTIIVFSEFLCGFISFIIICNSGELDDVKEDKGIKDVSDYALKSYLGVSGSTLISHGDSFILSTVFNQELLGLYSVAKSLYRLVVVIPQTVNSVIFGVLCELELKEASLLVKKVCKGFGVLFSIAIIVGLFILEELIVLVWGERFAVAFHPAIILMFAAALIASTAAINPFLLTQNRPLWSSKITLISGTVGLLSCILFAVYMGLIGAAISVLVSAVITSIMRIFYYKKIQSLDAF